MKNVLMALIFVTGFAMVYYFWPQSEDLPVHKKIEAIELQSVNDGSYNWDNSKIKIVSFFYTNCPDICPLTLVDMEALQTELKKEKLFGDQVELISITLDPEVDTVTKIKEYSNLYHSDPIGWEWLTGSSGEIKEVASDFQMIFEKVEGGFVTHSTKMYLVDEKLQIRGVYDMATRNQNVNIEQIMKEINTLITD